MFLGSCKHAQTCVKVLGLWRRYLFQPYDIAPGIHFIVERLFFDNGMCAIGKTCSMCQNHDIDIPRNNPRIDNFSTAETSRR